MCTASRKRDTSTKNTSRKRDEQKRRRREGNKRDGEQKAARGLGSGSPAVSKDKENLAEACGEFRGLQ